MSSCPPYVPLSDKALEELKEAIESAKEKPPVYLGSFAQYAEDLPSSTSSGNSIEWCENCKCYMVVCKTCGNNCCNGGYGTVDGYDCPDCPKAYEEQEALYSEEHLKETPKEKP